MNLIEKINNNVYYFFDDKEINKVIKTIIYPKMNKFDSLYTSILLDTLTYRLKNYDKLKFNLEKAINYDLIYNANIKEIDSNILINLEVSFVNTEYLLEEDIDKLVNFIDEIFEQMYIDIKDLELSIINYVKYLEKLDDKSSQMGKILINDYIYKEESTYLSYEESLKVLKSDELINNLMEILDQVIKSKNFYYFIEGSKITKNNLLEKIKKKSFNTLEIKDYSRKEVNFLEEEINLMKNDNQVSLIMTYQYNNISIKDEYVLKILNYILGGSSSSKLFMNVREKESICYSISSQDKFDYGIEVSVEVDKNNIELACNKINEQIKEIQLGNIDKEFENAKDKYIADLEANYNKGYLQKIMLDRNIIRKTDKYLIDNLVEEIRNISKEETVKLANKLSLKKILKIN